MIARAYHIEFLTPCFCGGAVPSTAELRAPSIRGELRWWFRCIGATRDEEIATFGGVHREKPVASVVAVRILQQPTGGQPDWNRKIHKQGTAPDTYLLGFFCGRTGRLDSPKGAIAPGSKAVIGLTFRRPPSPRLELAIRAFFSMGALGFRATRAAGAFASQEYRLTSSTWASLKTELANAGFVIALLEQDFGNDWSRLLHTAGDLLKNKLRSKRTGLGITSRTPSPLGSAEEKQRQKSALYFRPVRIDGHLRLALVEAPHHMVLGAPAMRAHRNSGPIVNLACFQ